MHGSCGVGIVDRDGLVGLYRGFVPNALKTLPNSRFMFFSFSVMFYIQNPFSIIYDLLFSQTSLVFCLNLLDKLLPVDNPLKLAKCVRICLNAGGSVKFKFNMKLSANL